MRNDSLLNVTKQALIALKGKRLGYKVNLFKKAFWEMISEDSFRWRPGLSFASWVTLEISKWKIWEEYHPCVIFLT